MKTSALLTLAIAMAATLPAFATTASIEGFVRNHKLEPIPFADVGLIVNGEMKHHTFSDDDGVYSISGIDPGLYILRVKATGYSEFELEVMLSTDVLFPQDVQLMPTTLFDPDSLPTITWEMNRPVIDIGDPSPGPEWTRKELENFAGTDPFDALQYTPGVYVQDDGDPVFALGSPARATTYIVDGVKISGDLNLPKEALEGFKVLFTGIPARYGDVTGAVIVVSTRLL